MEYVPTVSVIIPTRNRVSLLARSLQSVFLQTLKDFEVIVIDDASTDETKKFLSSIQDPRLITIAFEQKSGVSAARNKGIEMARGEFIAFLDDDDEWLPQKLFVQVFFFRNARDPLLGFIGSDFVYVGNVKKRKLPRVLVTPICFFTCDIGCGSGILARRSIFMRVGLFNPLLTHKEDLDLWVRICHRFHFVFLRDILWKRHIHGHNTSYYFSDRKILYSMLFSHEYFLLSHEHFLYQYPRVLNKLLYLLIKEFLKAGDRKKSYYYLKKLLKRVPLSPKPYILYIYFLSHIQFFKYRFEDI